MASLSRKGKSRPSPQMNVTPLVDVVLVLLIIFMIVMPAMEKGYPVAIPSIHNIDEAPDGSEPFTLSISNDGRYFLEKEQLPLEGLEAALREANDREPERGLVLRGDTDMDYEHARKLFRVCQGIGFPGVSLRVNQRGGGEDEENQEQHAAR